MTTGFSTTKPMASTTRFKKSSLLPRSNVPRVVLHDNCSQQHLLDMTLSHLTVQQRRMRRHLELRQRTFLTTQALKQEHLTARGVSHVSIVPVGVAQAYSKMTRFYQHRVKRVLPPSTVHIMYDSGGQEEIDEAVVAEQDIDDRPNTAPDFQDKVPVAQGNLQAPGTGHRGRARKESQRIDSDYSKIALPRLDSIGDGAVHRGLTVIGDMRSGISRNQKHVNSGVVFSMPHYTQTPHNDSVNNISDKGRVRTAGTSHGTREDNGRHSHSINNAYPNSHKNIMSNKNSVWSRRFGQIREKPCKQPTQTKQTKQPQPTPLFAELWRRKLNPDAAETNIGNNYEKATKSPRDIARLQQQVRARRTQLLTDPRFTGLREGLKSPELNRQTVLDDLQPTLSAWNQLQRQQPSNQQLTGDQRTLCPANINNKNLRRRPSLFYADDVLDDSVGTSPHYSDCSSTASEEDDHDNDK